MGLINKLKGVGMGLTVLGILASPGCAFREGNQRISFAHIPFIGIATTVEEYKPGTNTLRQKIELFATRGGYDMKQYGENGVYKGMCKIRIRGFLGDRTIHTTSYDKDGEEIYHKEGLPTNMPENLRIQIK
jgi:hypothetical protein